MLNIHIYYIGKNKINFHNKFSISLSKTDAGNMKNEYLIGFMTQVL